MVLVPANMLCFGFNPCKKIVVFGPCNFFLTIFKKQEILQGPFLKIKYFAGTKNYKIGSVIMCHVCKSSQKWAQRLFSKTKYFAWTKNYKKKIDRD
jgi:hypothetical protein